MIRTDDDAMTSATHARASGLARALPYLVAVSMAAIAVSGCGASTSPSTDSSSGSAASTVTAGRSLGTASATVNATDNLAFAPSAITVKAGQIVEWANTGTMGHNIIFASQSAADASNFAVGDKWQVKFSGAGTYTYQCTFHPGMTGTVTVAQ